MLLHLRTQKLPQTLSDGYEFEFGETFKNLEEARERLAIVVPAALILILVLIFMAFRSLRQTLMIATGIPLALSGGILGLALRGQPFSISAAVVLQDQVLMAVLVVVVVVKAQELEAQAQVDREIMVVMV